MVGEYRRRGVLIECAMYPLTTCNRADFEWRYYALISNSNNSWTKPIIHQHSLNSSKYY